MTGKEILEKEFEKAGMRGYRADEVDSFLQSIAAFVDKQSAQIKELTYKIQILADKIEEYKKDEENIRDALLGAQKMGSSILNEAKSKADSMTREAKLSSEEVTVKSQEQADKILRDAKLASEEMLSQAKSKIELLTKESLLKANDEVVALKKSTEAEKQKLDKMKQEVSLFRSNILKQYKAHLDLLTNLPSIEENNTEEKTALHSSEKTSKHHKTEKSEATSQEPKRSVTEIQKPEIFDVQPQTVTSEILPVASEEELAAEEKQQTKEYKHKIVGVSEESIEEKENDFSSNLAKPNYVAKFGELDFGNYNKDK